MTYQRTNDPQWWMNAPTEEEVEAEMEKKGKTCYRIFLSDGSDDIEKWTPADPHWRDDLISAHHDAYDKCRSDMYVLEPVRTYAILAYRKGKYRRITERERDKALCDTWDAEKREKAKHVELMSRLEEKKAVAALRAWDSLW